MAESEGKELEVMLLLGGMRLQKPPSSLDQLLPLLDEVEICLTKVALFPPESTHKALSGIETALVADELLKHSDVDVKVAVASCISQITRISAPDAPYDDDQMKELFVLTVSSLDNLSDQSSRSYNKRILILETIAKIRSCVLMLDLECDSLIVEMFQHFLKSIRDFHQKTVFTSMETIMSLVIEESEDISVELLTPILNSLKKDNGEIIPIARKLGEKVFENCASKLRPYLTQAVRSLEISLNDYSEVVASICLEKTVPVQLPDGNFSSEVKEFKGQAVLLSHAINVEIMEPKEKNGKGPSAHTIPPHVDSVLQFLSSHFSKVEARFDKMDARFDSIDENFKTIERRFARTDEQFNKMQEKFVSNDSHFVRVDEQVDETHENVSVMEGHAKSADECFARMYSRFGVMEDHAKSIDECFARVDSRFGVMEDHAKSIDERFARMELQFGMMEDHAKSIDECFARTDSRFGMVEDHAKCIDEHLARMEAQFSLMEDHAKSIDERFKTDGRFSGIEVHAKCIDERFSRTNAQLGVSENHAESIDECFVRTNARFGVMEDHGKCIGERFGTTDARFGVMEDQAKSTKATYDDCFPKIDEDENSLVTFEKCVGRKDKGFKTVQEHLTAIDERARRIEEAFDMMQEKLKSYGRSSVMKACFDVMQDCLESTKANFSKTDIRINVVHEKISVIDGRIAHLDMWMEMVTSWLGTICTMLSRP